MKRLVRTALLVTFPLAVVGASLYAAHKRAAHADTVATSCIGSLTSTTYPAGVATAPLSSSTAVAVVAGTGLQLNTDLAPFNAQNITLPFDQQVDIQYVYRNAGASHSFGWFYLDQIMPFLHYDTETPPQLVLNDNDGDGIYDWFETQNGTTRPYDGLWHQTTPGIPDLLNGSMNYSDGGAMPHMPNILETLTGAGKGQMVFKLCDDDTDLSTYGVGSTAGSSPITDVSATNDGIPDYDVNGDGIIGNEADRDVSLGVIQGNREIVFFAVTYYSTDEPASGLGTGTSTAVNVPVGVAPAFTKNILNPDRNTMTPGQLLDRAAIKCNAAEGGADTTCYDSFTPNATNGWLDANARTRLNTPTYGNIDLSSDNSVYTVTVAPDGSPPHFVVFPPASNPNLWIIGYEDLPIAVSDHDYNDVVVLVNRENGGQVISQVVSDIPPAQLSTTAISEIHVTYNISFPAPGCTGVTGAAVNLYYSVDNGVTWNAIPEASATSGDLTIDVLGAGVVGSQLKWRADFVSPSQTCQPVLNSFNIGYEAVSNGIYKYAASIPLSNVDYDGALETPPYPTTEPPETRNDYSLRGHFYSTQLYNPTNPNVTAIQQNWDSGQIVSQTTNSPDLRNVYTAINGQLTPTFVPSTTIPFNVASEPTLYPLILPVASRSALNSATLVYDYTGDNVVDDHDAQFLIQWTRGWEYPGGITMTPTPALQPQIRGWRLGSIHNSSPAIIGPPVRPFWIDGTSAPPTLIAKWNTFASNNNLRNTRAVVGSQDGMVHAFDAGAYRDGSATDCIGGANLNRGCYATPAGYGTGNEIWTWVPPSMLSQLKNNTPMTKSYLPGSNPVAEVDGSISVDDVYDPNKGTSGDFRTIAYASLGTIQRYITAIDMSSDTPLAVWAGDWTDADFNGSNLSPSVGLTSTGTTAPGYRHMVITTSGLASLADDLYMYLLDALTGVLIKKIQLNVGANNAQSTGIASYTNLVDADNDGLVDRAYAVDTSGRIFKVDTTTNATCMIASVGETVYSGAAVALADNSTPGAPKILLYIGGGSNPDGTGTVASQYHVFSYEDDDPVGTCSNSKATLQYTAPLDPGSKVWSSPTIADNIVYFAESSASSSSICATGDGAILGLSTTGTGGAPSSFANMGSTGGSSISSMRVYDGHVIVNTVGGSTTVLGGNVWNNASTSTNISGNNTAAGLFNTWPTLLWQEL